MTLSKRLLLTVTMLTMSGVCFAQTAPVAPPAATPGAPNPAISNHPGFDKLTPEQREARRAEMREKYKNATPAEREQMRAAHEAHREERLKNATPEERKRIEEHMAEHRERWEEHHPGEPPPPPPPGGPHPASAQGEPPPPPPPVGAGAVPQGRTPPILPPTSH